MIVQLLLQAGIAVALKWNLTEQPNIIFVDAMEVQVPITGWWGDGKDFSVSELIRLEVFTDGKDKVILGYGPKSKTLAIKVNRYEDVPGAETT